MMNKLPALQFYPGDWRRDPGVQSLTFEERGIWIELLFLMHESEQRGKLVLNGRAASTDRLARMLHIDPEKLETVIETLLDLGVASRCPETGALMNRRMVRDEAILAKRRAAGRLGGNPNLVKQKSTTRLTTRLTTEPSKIQPHHASRLDDADDCADDCLTDRPAQSADADSSNARIGSNADLSAIDGDCENPSKNGRLAASADYSDTQMVNQIPTTRLTTRLTKTQPCSENVVNHINKQNPTPSSSSSSSIYSSLSYTEREARTSGREPPKRGTRLPEPFIVTDEMRTWAHERCPDADLDLETEKFVNYWSAKAGRDAIKLDWRRTWQNWLLRADEFRRNNRSDTNGNYRSTSRDRLAAHAAILERYPDERQPSETRGDADGAAQTLVN